MIIISKEDMIHEIQEEDSEGVFSDEDNWKDFKIDINMIIA